MKSWNDDEIYVRRKGTGSGREGVVDKEGTGTGPGREGIVDKEGIGTGSGREGIVDK